MRVQILPKTKNYSLVETTINKYKNWYSKVMFMHSHKNHIIMLTRIKPRQNNNN